MKSNGPEIIETPSAINYPYATIRITQSRLDKGLLAIPVSLSEHFPSHNERIQIYLNDSPVSEIKQYSSYSSSTRECRIGGVRQWLKQNNIKSGDEIVIQFLDEEQFTYRLIPERNFILETRELQDKLDNSKNEEEASKVIKRMAQWTNLDESKTQFSEFYRLSRLKQSEGRQYIRKSPILAKENVPANLRTILRDIYGGHCQVCNFWFLNKDKNPYFDIHHIDPSTAHHPKNLIVVCGNCHNQFEHAEVRQDFSDEHWLVRVSFNESIYLVKQALLETKVGFSKELFV